jgi:hypothetical protein
MVSRAHIDAMVQLAIEGPRDSNRRWDVFSYDARPLTSKTTHAQRRELGIEVRPENASVIGQMLAAENARSLRYRYDDDADDDMVAEWADAGYAYRRHHRKLTAHEGMGAIACYEYQACEAPEWHGSEAQQFCRELMRALVGFVYDTSHTWDVREEWLNEIT